MSAPSIYAIVEGGIVTNTVLWDGADGWQPPPGAEVVAISEGIYTGIGAVYSGGVLGAPPENPAP